MADDELDAPTAGTEPEAPPVEPVVVEPVVTPEPTPPVAPEAAPAPPPLSALTRAIAAEQGVHVPNSPAPSKDDTPPPGTPSGVSALELGQTRKEIAYRLIYIMSAVIAAYLLVSLIFAQSCWMSSTCSVKDAYGMAAGSFATVFTALVGIVGSVVGFYFGSKSEGNG